MPKGKVLRTSEAILKNELREASKHNAATRGVVEDIIKHLKVLVSKNPDNVAMHLDILTKLGDIMTSQSKALEAAARWLPQQKDSPPTSQVSIEELMKE